MKTREELLEILERRELHRYAIIGVRRHLCERCGRLTWDRRLCRDCRREITARVQDVTA